MRAFRLHGGSTRGLGIFAVIVGMLALPSMGPLALGVVAIGIVLWILPWLIARRILGDSAILRAPLTGHLDEQGFTAESPHGRSNIAWTLFHQALVAPDIILLYISRQQFHLLPRAFFASDEAFAEAQELVRRNVRPRKRRAWVLVFLLWLVVIFCVWALWQLSSTP